MKKKISIIGEFDLERMEQKCFYSFLNFASLTSFYSRENSQQIYYFCDGILMAKLVSLLTKEKINRISFDFTSIADPVFEFIERNKKRLFVLGASKLEIELFCEKIRNKYPDIVIVGYRNGFFSNEEAGNVINEIAIRKPDYILLGLGAGKQEQFGCMLLSELNNISMFTCGGFIRQESNSSKNYYPRLIDKLNLRAFYRMYKEPHTIRRYLIDYPKNSLIFIYYYLTGKIEIDIKK